MYNYVLAVSLLCIRIVTDQLDSSTYGPTNALTDGFTNDPTDSSNNNLPVVHQMVPPTVSQMVL